MTEKMNSKFLEDFFGFYAFFLRESPSLSQKTVLLFRSENLEPKIYETYWSSKRFSLFLNHYLSYSFYLNKIDNG